MGPFSQKPKQPVLTIWTWSLTPCFSASAWRALYISSPRPDSQPVPPHTSM